MEGKQRVGVVAVLLLSLAVGVRAQFGMGLGPPQMQGVFSPVVGSGSAYELEGKGGHRQIEISVVDKEVVEGNTGYWTEWTIEDPKTGGPVYLKHLILLQGNSTTVSRMIFQMPGQPPMEMSTAMMGRMGGGGSNGQNQSSDIRKEAELLGKESITTPAGTFSCEHLRTKDGADLWVSDKVAPWGLVKMTSKDTSMTLVKVITGAKTHITGTPVKFDPMQMGRPPGKQP